MAKTVSFKRLILRAVLRQVSPMVIRLVSVSDHMPLPEFHDVFRTILGWNGDLGYIIRVHGQEFNSFRRKTRSKALHEFKHRFPARHYPQNRARFAVNGVADAITRNRRFSRSFRAANGEVSHPRIGEAILDSNLIRESASLPPSSFIARFW